MKAFSTEEINLILGKVFRDYRRKNHLTQENIAEKLGISTKYISRIENGNGGVKLENLVKYINILGISPNVIFNELIVNEALKPEIHTSSKINELTPEQIKFINDIIDLIKNL